MLIRRALEDDVSSLNALFNMLIVDEKKYDDNVDETFVVDCFYENFLVEDDKVLLVALDDKRIIGYLYGYVLDDATYLQKVGVLDAIYVLSSYRGMHVGSSLLKSFKDWLFNLNINLVQVSVFKDNFEALGLYEKNDFAEVKKTLVCKL